MLITQTELNERVVYSSEMVKREKTTPIPLLQRGTQRLPDWKFKAHDNAEERGRALEQALRSSPTDRLTLAERRRALASGLGLTQTQISRLDLPATVARLDDALSVAERAIGALTIELPPDVLEQLVELIAAKVETRLTAAAQSAPTDRMNTNEAAAYIRKKPQRIYDLVSSRRLHPKRDGSSLLFERKELDAYLEGRVGAKASRRDR